ncbi:hypothetical protein [Salegentibacter chungangensis]|uniref:DUF4203 domain-containing protein n=1 Tax=Salegentibacter chungangensis TaxID=1335724 RepID=A0ABW3NQ64_9FLAO
METVILIITGIVSAIATYVVNNRLKQGAVRASSLLSLMVGLFFYFVPDLLSTYLTRNIPLVFIGASFIGMVSSKILSSYLLLGLSGIIFSVLFVNSSEYFDGYGGGLGTTAAISLLVSLSMAIIARKKPLKKLKELRHKK